MRIETSSGSASAALGIIGTGLAMAFPEEKWIGLFLVGIGLLVFLFDVKIERGHLRATGPTRHRMNNLGPWILIVTGPVFGLIWLYSNWQPRFVISIVAADIYVPPSPPNSTTLMLMVALDNIGSPSIAKNWALSVTLPGQVPKTALFMRLGSVSGIELKNTDSSTKKIPREDALDEKTENSLVIGRVQGRLWFILEGTKNTDVINPRTILTLSVEDKYGSPEKVASIIGEISGR